MSHKQKQIVFRIVAILAFALGVAVVCSLQQQRKLTPARFLVQIPPQPRPLTELKSIPNVCGDLIVRLESDNSLKLNSEKITYLSEETNKLTSMLREVFDERIKMGVYDPKFSNHQELSDEERIYKRVVIAAPDSASYEDVLRIIDAVKGSGTNDIWIQIDGDAYNWLIFEAVEPSR